MIPVVGEVVDDLEKVLFLSETPDEDEGGHILPDPMVQSHVIGFFLGDRGIVLSQVETGGDHDDFFLNVVSLKLESGFFRGGNDRLHVGSHVPDVGFYQRFTHLLVQGKVVDIVLIIGMVGVDHRRIGVA